MMKRVVMLAVLAVVCLCIAPMAQGNTQDWESPYGDTYTPEELAALDEALWAGNMTRADMHFKKDYTAGHGCFPIVREMMHDPLLIAPWMDGVAAHNVSGLSPLTQQVIQAAETGYGPDSVMPYTECAAISEWNWLLNNTEDHWSIEDFISYVEVDCDDIEPDESDGFLQDALIINLPTNLAWHDVFTPPARFDADKLAAVEEWTAEQDGTWWVDELAEDTYLDTSNVVCDYLLFQDGFTEYIKRLPAEFYPQDEPVIAETDCGLVVIGTPRDDTYTDMEIALLIEPGGNDTYTNCQLGGVSDPTQRWIATAIDLGGDDFYDCADVDITLGAAVLGVAAFYDLGGGDDRYYAGSCSLGAAMGGVATFYDDGGSDYYSSKVYTQGAAGFGIGIMLDDSVANAPEFDTAEGNDALIDGYETGESDTDTHTLMDNDYYTAWSNAQAFARPRGVAMCINRRGNETYHAGGVYLHAPLFADRYQSFSQGFSIGDRGIDWAGGIAMLIDYDGNDRYLGDIYNQGVGYWYGAGLLWDGGGNDTYEMTQYGQGSGIHLAIGGLVDVAGNDSYIMHSGLGQGGSHDLAASILHDRGGDDRYHGNTSCNGGALTGSVALHIDRAGNDTYAGRPGNGVNFADNRRINIGLLLDVGGGADEYMGVMADDATWLHGNIGMGADMPAPPEVAAAGQTSGPNKLSQPEDAIPIPEICNYQGPLTQEVFDELWAISTRWAVGDNRVIVPKARERLIAFGPDVLPYIAEEMESDYSLSLLALKEVLAALHNESAVDVEIMIEEQAISEQPVREKVALYLIGELKLANLEYLVVGFLEHDDQSMVRRAIGVLTALESHAADAELLAMLESGDEALVKSALVALASLEVDCFPAFEPLLSHPLLSVRGELVQQLVAHYAAYGAHIDTHFAALANATTEAEVRALRSLLQVYASSDSQPAASVLATAADTLAHPDWGVRADTIRAVANWRTLAAGDLAYRQELRPLIDTIVQLRWKEQHQHVRWTIEDAGF